MEYIILDLETTGLDPSHADIIEIGAILISDGKIKAEFNELADPGYLIPVEITKLTGISNEMIAGKPSPKDLIKGLKEFIGDRDVIGHNLYGFDLKFLEKYGLKLNKAYDLMDFAFFVLPTLEHHSVSYLSSYFNLGEELHRALDDCHREFKILNALSNSFTKKPKKIKTSLKYLAESYHWWWNFFLIAESASFGSFLLIMPAHERYRKTQSSQEAFDIANQKVTQEEVDKYFLTSSDTCSEYSEDRPDQRKMSWSVANSFNLEKHAVIEAGTGIGKSKGYLTPSTLFAIKNSIPIVISTYTKVLQDQLFTKEIPHIKSIIKKDLQVALLKGKTNYVCLTKADEIYHETADRRLDIQKTYSLTRDGVKYDRPVSFLLLSAWILQTERGDWDEIPFWAQSRFPKSIEMDICNHDETCAPGMCDGFDENKCFLAKAKLRAKDADIVIINHAILLTGIIKKEIAPTEGQEDNAPKFVYSHTILSNESKYLVLDEAHFLEDAATSAWDVEITYSSLVFVAGLIYGKRGLYNSISKLISQVDINQKELESLLDTFVAQESKIISLLNVFRDPALANFVGHQSNSYAITKIINEEVRRLSEWGVISTNLTDLHESLLRVSNILRSIANILKNANADEKQVKRIDKRAEIARRLVEAIKTFLVCDDFYVRYLRLNDGEVQFLANPISVAELLKEYVYDNFRSVCLVSATMKVDGNFSFFAERCGLNLIEKAKVDFVSYDSTFDFANSMKFLLPKNISYREDPSGFLAAAKPFILSAILASNGGSLVLCSSHEQVREISDYISDSLSKAGLSLYRQDQDHSVNSVVRGFREDVNSVLVGTTSLWHGVDVPGPSLRSLFILKIPYKMPTEPIFFARKEALEKRGKKSFYCLSQPLACIDLRQGIGRLIRKKTDKGIVVLLDERLLESQLLCSAVPVGITPRRIDQEVILNELRELNMTVKPTINTENIDTPVMIQDQSQESADTEPAQMVQCSQCGAMYKKGGLCTNLSSHRSISSYRNNARGRRY